MSTVVDFIMGLSRRVAEIERRMNQSSLAGNVASVDAARGTVRIDLGPDDDGGRLLSPPIPYAQQAGALKIHTPPTVGQQMTISAPSGDLAAGVASPLSWSAADAAPSQDGNQNVITFGAVTIALTDSGATISADGVVVSISAAGLSVTGGGVTHDGTNIGATHRHGGVDSGPSRTSTPE